MQIAGQAHVLRFMEKHNRASAPLRRWIKLAKEADWADHGAIKKTFGSIDKAYGHYIFDLGGNKYRLVARVNVAHQVIRVIGVYTHAEYDRLDLSKL